MIDVLGVDPGVKVLGLARTDGRLTTIKATTGASDPVRRLYELDRALWKEVRSYPPTPRLIVVEGYLLHGPGSIARIRAGEVGGMVRVTGFRLGAHVIEIPPGSLKRFATGNGNADKAQMVEAARVAHAEFSRPPSGGKDEPHDEADAFHLRRIGRMAYGHETATEDHQREVLASITWPVIR